MGVGGSRTRVKLFAGLAVLGAIWAFATFATGGEAARLFQTRAVGDHLGQPADTVILELQAERRLSTAWLGDAGTRTGANTDRQAALAAQRARTDQASAALRQSAAGKWARWAATDAARERVEALLDRLDRLPGIRGKVDGRGLDRERTAAEYTGIIDVAFRIYSSPRLWGDPALARREDALVSVSRAREALAREDTLVRGALAAGGLTNVEREQLAQLVGAQRFMHAEAQSALTPDDLDRYQVLTADPRFAALRTMEDRLVHTPAAAARAVEAEWTGPAETVLTQLRDLTQAGAGEVVQAATPGGVATIVRAGLVGGGGFIALVAVLALALRRSRAGSSTVTTQTSMDWLDDDATREVPAVTAGAGAGSGAVAGGGELYALMLDLNRRNQALLHRQLRVLDAMERRESDDEDLGDLFRADHLATRVRRNVEKLIALAGGAPARRWRQPVPMVDVVRAAAAEVAEYPRVAASEIEPAALAGSAVTDVSHLLSELMENATMFSPAQTRVRVTGGLGAEGYRVTVLDSGPGMSTDDLATAHEVLAESDPPSGGTWWGLYAVGRLAERHGITVTLRAASAGGLAAEVMIPSDLISVPAPEPDSGTGAATRDTLGEGGSDPDCQDRDGEGREGEDRNGEGRDRENPNADDPNADDPNAEDPNGEDRNDRNAEERENALPDRENAADGGGGPNAGPGPDGVRRTASGLPTRIRNATISAPVPRTRRSTGDASGASRESVRLARLRKRAGASTETMELPLPSGGPEPTALDQQSTVGQPGRKRS